MIPVHGAASVTYHNEYEVNVGAHGDEVGIVMIDRATSHAHVYAMPREQAEIIEQGLAKARTGIHVAKSMPNGDGS